ncbi:hypothetical protein BT63DRAFT_415400 [Microthyrium microscopicum]|uniref:Uncharacterized protein n=1 Tax=Microthyrium microscopicum TaxID=703497 RepID=A0A6A6U8E5_9PEZI|nr:hypothetical protein BT63DRAFT_415400 [Microthyrium microscopicum]
MLQSPYRSSAAQIPRVPVSAKQRRKHRTRDQIRTRAHQVADHTDPLILLAQANQPANHQIRENAQDHHKRPVPQMLQDQLDERLERGVTRLELAREFLGNPPVNPLGTALYNYDYTEILHMSHAIDKKCENLKTRVQQFFQNVFSETVPGSSIAPHSTKTNRYALFGQNIISLADSENFTVEAVRTGFLSLMGIISIPEQLVTALSIFESASALNLLRAKRDFLHHGYSQRIAQFPRIRDNVVGMMKFPFELRQMVFKHLYANDAIIEVKLDHVTIDNYNNRGTTIAQERGLEYKAKYNAYLPRDEHCFLSAAIVNPELSQQAAAVFYGENTFRVTFAGNTRVPAQHQHNRQLKITKLKIDLLASDYYGSQLESGLSIRNLILQHESEGGYNHLRKRIPNGTAPPAFPRVSIHGGVSNHVAYTTRHVHGWSYETVFQLSRFTDLKSLTLELTNQYGIYEDIRAFTGLLKSLKPTVKIYLSRPHLNQLLQINEWLESPKENDDKEYCRLFDFNFVGDYQLDDSTGASSPTFNGFAVNARGCFDVSLSDRSRIEKEIAKRQRNGTYIQHSKYPHVEPTIKEWYNMATIHPGAMRVFFAEHARTLDL